MFRRDGKLIYRFSNIDDFFKIYKIFSNNYEVNSLPQFIEDTYIWTKASIPANSTINFYVYYDCPEPPKDPFNDGSEIAFYRFNGNTNDEHGNYNGTPNNITYKKGLWYDCAYFDYNSNSFVDLSGLGLINNLSGSYSYSFWFFNVSDESLYTCSLFSVSYSQISIMFDDNYLKVHWKGYNEYSYSLSEIPIGTWNQLVVCYDADNKKGYIYLNGNLIVEENNINSETLEEDIVYIGTNSDGYGYLGMIDNFRIFNRCLTATEVSQLYDMEKLIIIGDGKEIFEFFDDFNNLDTSIWEIDSNISYDIIDSNLKITRGGITYTFNISPRVQDGYKIKCRAKIIEYKEAYSGVFNGIFSSKYIDETNINSDAVVMLIYYYYDNDILIKIGDGCEDYFNISDDYANIDVKLGSYYLFESDIIENNIKIYLNDSEIRTYNVASWCKDLIYMKLGSFNENSSIISTMYDWIYIVKLPINNNINISISHEESGNWEIDGIIYTKRKKVSVTNTTSEDLNDCKIRLELNNFDNDLRSKIFTE